MKRKFKYLLFILLLCSCEDVQDVPESFSEVNEFSVRKEQLVTTTAKSSGSKDAFGINDEIYIYGYSKLNTGDPGDRFMPKASGTIGAAYQYHMSYNNISQEAWYRFQRVQSGSDQEMGFWRTKQYHDFVAYYSESSDMVFSMDETGLPEEDLLWGKVEDVYFSGEAHIIPEIKLQHQLSRIRVEVVHDMQGITSENFEIVKIEFNLSKKEAAFDRETRDWINIDASGQQIVKNFPPDYPSGFGMQMDENKFPRAELVEIADWWVLPDCKLSNFEFTITQSGAEKSFSDVLFESFLDNTGGPAEIITKPGCITVLRIEFGEVKQIIFTVSLEDWDVKKESSSITEEEIAPW